MGWLRNAAAPVASQANFALDLCFASMGCFSGSNETLVSDGLSGVVWGSGIG